MGIETLNAMNEAVQRSLLMMLEMIVMVAVLCALAGLGIYLAGVAWLWFEEKQRHRTATQMVQRASPMIIWKPASGVINQSRASKERSYFFTEAKQRRRQGKHRHRAEIYRDYLPNPED